MNTSNFCVGSESRLHPAHTPWKSPESPRSMSARSLLTPPSDKEEDDVRSINSDISQVTSASEESRHSSKVRNKTLLIYSVIKKSTHIL